MNLFDLLKATVACGGIAFLMYSVPEVSQAAVIGILTLLWLSYAHRTLARLLRK